jgi:hypothetical protein
MHEPLMIAPKRLAVPCILDSFFPYSLVDKVNVIMLELVLHDVIVGLNKGGAHGDLRGEDGLSPVQ